MKITILTLFPEMFTGVFDHSIIKMAKDKGSVSVDLVNIRNFGLTKHHTVDDTPFGGGIGMVLRVDVLHSAIKSVIDKKDKTHIVLLDARGTTYDQKKAKELTRYDHLIIICGHYEGVDERIRSYVDEEISIGNYILTGGEIPSMAIVDSITRLIPGVLKEGATEHESFSLIDELNNINVEYPQYTQPREYDGKVVPDILLSGNHQKIGEWRMKKAKELTQIHRHDLINKSKMD